MPVGAPHLAEVHLVPSAHDLLALGSPVAIDIPIGMMDRAADGSRPPDRAAIDFLVQRNRDFLANIHSRVFAAPSREHLADFCAGLAYESLNARYPVGRKLSRQCFNICPKIVEVDRLLSDRPDLPIYEVHPEVTFAHLADRTLSPKAKSAGRTTRAAELEKLGFLLDPLVAALGPKTRSVGGKRRQLWNTDDLHDACIAAWSADRIATGAHAGLPTLSERDSHGLRRVIHY